MDIYLKYLKNNLEELNYPSINILDEFEVVELFSAKNRYSLLCWIVKGISSEFVPPLEHSPTAEILLADYFFEGGFCRSTQKSQFVKGSGLNPYEVINIFQRIFTFMHSLKNKRSVKPQEDNNTIKLLNTFMHQDTNIFPSCGPLKVYSDVERQQKLALYQSDIKKLEKATEEFDLSSLDSTKKNMNSVCNEIDFKHLIKGFEEKAFKIGKANATIKRNYKKDNEIESPVKCNEELLTQCKEEVKVLVEIIENYDSIRNILSGDAKKVSVNDELKEIGEIIATHGILCQEIGQLKRSHVSS